MYKTLAWVALAMFAFAANSLLCRLALVETSISPLQFSLVRVASAAVCLSVVCAVIKRPCFQHGSWLGAVLLSAYVLGFSFSYRALSTGTGALLLFAAVQLLMMGVAIIQGARLRALQWVALGMALAGVVWLMLPSVQSPPLMAAVFMITAGIAWGGYSIVGRGSAAPLLDTASNFVRATLLIGAVALPLIIIDSTKAEGLVFSLDRQGVVYGLLSGVFASGCGYALWYRVLPRLATSAAAMVQLSVPVLATWMGVLILSEPVTLTLVSAGILVLGGIALFTQQQARKKNAD